MQTANICIFASGNGSNAVNLIKESLTRDSVKVSFVLSDNPEAPILEKCRQYNIPARLVPYKGSKKKHEEEIINLLKGKDIHWIFLAGYMRILSSDFIGCFKLSGQRSRIINIHPSCLPEFKGRNAYEQAFEANVGRSGVSIHFVDSGVDTGEIILQNNFPRLPEDTFNDFKDRGMQLEYALYPKVLDMISPNDITIQKDAYNDH